MGDDRLLRIYLNDHYAGAVGGSRLADRCRSSNRDSALGDYLETFVQEAGEDQGTLEEVMDRVGAGKDLLKLGAVRIAELAGRFKLNGRLLSYSDLSRLEELEALCLGVEGKLELWVALQELSSSDRRLAGVDYDVLIRRAKRQRSRLEAFRLEAARTALGLHGS